MLTRDEYEPRYPKLLCWALALLAGAAIWLAMLAGLWMIGTCVLNGVC